MSTISVICSTYNQPDVLNLVLFSLSQQSYPDFEMIVADDGSNDETKKIIESWKSEFKNPIKHIWHEDIGYRKAEIHNKALKEASGELLIFIDGDCVMSKDYVLDHHSIFLKHKHEKYVFMGRRIELGEEFTSILTKDNLNKLLIENVLPLKFFFSCLKRDSKGFGRNYSIKNKILRKMFRANNVQDILGSNFSVKKSTVIDVNGFNEDLKSYWGEDGDLFIRLRNIGCILVGMKYYAVQYHLYHTRRDPDQVQVNRYLELLHNKEYVWAESGLDKY